MGRERGLFARMRGGARARFIRAGDAPRITHKHQRTTRVILPDARWVDKYSLSFILFLFYLDFSISCSVLRVSCVLDLHCLDLPCSDQTAVAFSCTLSL